MLSSKSVSNENEWVERAVEYIENHFKDNITVVDMAKTVGLERSYFSTLFKSRTGISPHEYLTQFRIKRACALMKGTEYSIAKIADNTGFDPQNFARIFKREVGVSPRKYRATVMTQCTDSKID
jgi:transcriptional regulator GlxA family with amidase domain